jgi:hypothetical protein
MDCNTTNKGGDHFDRRLETFCRLKSLGNFSRMSRNRPSELKELKNYCLGFGTRVR